MEFSQSIMCLIERLKGSTEPSKCYACLKKGIDHFVCYHFKHELGNSVARDTVAQSGLICTAFPTKAKRQTSKAYYSSNARLFVRATQMVLNRAIDNKERVNIKSTTELLTQMLIELIDLFRTCADDLLDVPDAFSAYVTPFSHYREIFHAAEKIAYNCQPVFSYKDAARQSSTPLLRAAIEVRFRSAFGVYYSVNDEGGFDPISMSLLFEAVERAEVPDEAFCLPLTDIVRFYKWANAYVHSGLKVYTWNILFALECLRPLMVGSTTDGSYSVNMGIKCSQAKIEEVRRELLSMTRGASISDIGGQYTTYD